jgi:hypothetical protein
VTVGDFLGVLRRRWFLALLWVVGSACIGHVAATYPPVYWTRAEVRLLPPQTARNPNQLEFTTGGVIATAGLVARAVSATAEEPATASTVLLHDRGVRRGTSVVVPNSGGQWSANFQDPILDVQAVAGSADEAVQLREEKVAEITAELQRMQRGVPRALQITTATTPAEPQVVVKQGSRTRALAVLAGVLGVLGAWLLVLADRAAVRLQARARARRARERVVPGRPRWQGRRGSAGGVPATGQPV